MFTDLVPLVDVEPNAFPHPACKREHISLRISTVIWLPIPVPLLSFPRRVQPTTCGIFIPFSALKFTVYPPPPFQTGTHPTSYAHPALHERERESTSRNPSTKELISGNPSNLYWKATPVLKNSYLSETILRQHSICRLTLLAFDILSY